MDTEPVDAPEGHAAEIRYVQQLGQRHCGWPFAATHRTALVEDDNYVERATDGQRRGVVEARVNANAIKGSIINV